MRGPSEMESIYAFLGPAGSGKTFSLIEKLEELCTDRDFADHQSVLALTFMHGSRRRISDRLAKGVAAAIPVECETIDSFCLRLVNRYRSHINKRKKVSVVGNDDGWLELEHGYASSFATIRSAAVELLTTSVIKKTIAATYPIVLIDEFQDCEGDLLNVVKLLSEFSTLLVAADEFQNLRSSGSSDSINWVRSGKRAPTELTSNHRTNDDKLLATSSALREGLSAEQSIDVMPQPAPGLVAYGLASQIAWGKTNGAKSHVIICPSRPENSPWVQKILNSLERELGKKKKLPAIPFTWETNEHDRCDAAASMATEFSDSKGRYSKDALQLLTDHEDRILRQAASTATRIVSLRGVKALSDVEMRQIIELSAHSISAYRSESQYGRIGMTVHGAKNREFDFVFILWPYTVRADAAQNRRLLYNAVTRARRGAVLFVQGEEKRIIDDETLALLKCGIVPPWKPQKASKKRTAAK